VLHIYIKSPLLTHLYTSRNWNLISTNHVRLATLMKFRLVDVAKSF